MVITYHGGECFKVTFGDTTLLFNPPGANSKLKAPRGSADVVFSTTKHEDMNGTKKFAENDAFVIDGPGAYEVAGVVVKGLLTESGYGSAEYNTMYHVTLEGMELLFCGALKSRDLPQEARAGIDTVDILFVPIGGDGVLSASDAHKLAVELEPHVVIPMHHEEMGEKGALSTFLKEGGAEKEKPQEKYTVKRKDLEGKTGEIVVLAAK